MYRVRAIAFRFLIMSLVLSLGVVACKDDSPTGAEGPVGDEGLATSLISDLIVPLIETLSLNSYVSLLPAPGLPAPTLNQPDCSTLPICSSGTATSCLGETGYVVTFGGCDLNGTVVDGSITLVPVDETSGAATVDITLDGDDLRGTVTWATFGCFAQEFNMVFNSPNISVSFTGSMTFCDPPVIVNDIIVPSDAFFNLVVVAANRQVHVEIFNGEGGPQLSIEVSDLEFNYIMSCSGPLFGKLSCFTGDY